jgi:hypothetical protein
LEHTVWPYCTEKLAWNPAVMPAPAQRGGERGGRMGRGER